KHKMTLPLFLLVSFLLTVFPKAYIRWLKDGRPLPSSKHLGVTKFGSLKIQFLSAEDIGVYKCVAGPTSDIFTLQLIGTDSKLTGRLSTASPPRREDMLPSCHWHHSGMELIWPGVSVTLLPPGIQEALLITFNGNTISVYVSCKPALLSWSQVSGISFMLCLCLICLTDKMPNWSERSTLETYASRPVITRQQQTQPVAFQKNINISIGHSTHLTNATRSLTIGCPAEGFPPPKISWTKDGALLVFWDTAEGLHILQPRLSDRGRYKCIATNTHGSDSETSQLLVAVVGRREKKRSTSTVHLPFSSAEGVLVEIVYILHFVFCLSGVPPPTVTWNKKNGLLGAIAVPLPSGSLWIRNVSLHNQGIYSCTATNAIGKSTASTVLQLFASYGVHQSFQYHFLYGLCCTFGSTELKWRFGEWTTCSASCGNRGTWLRRIHCVNLDGKAVQSTMCQHIPKPITSPVTCNRQNCPPRWSASEWSKCSASCGGGWRRRQVSCQQSEARGAVRTLTAAACERTSRKCSLTCQFYVTPCQCSGRCLGPAATVQKRSVLCHHANGSSYTDCDLRDRPASVRNCSSDLCDVQWRPRAWRPCTVVCGSGFQSRRVDCVYRRSGRTLEDQHCAGLQQPPTWQHCNSPSCGSKYECANTERTWSMKGCT
uniref:Ig-like domain-containing protein n=1 Tax=Cyclopterus lumpus TaxID=8103 RepID=A0A8C2WA64_CYCLU